MSLTELKRQIKSLKEQKGVLSRQIGQCKKTGESYDSILSKMKDVSACLKEKESLLFMEKKQANSSNTSQKEIIAAVQQLPQRLISTKNKNRSEPKIQIKIIENNKVEKERWNKFVDNHLSSCVYQRYEFRDVIEKSFHHKTFYLVAFDHVGEIQGILPAVYTQSKIFGNYITTMPFFNYGGPLSNHPYVDELLILALSYEAKKAGAKYIEIREVQPRKEYPTRTDKISMFLSLPRSSDQLWQNIGTKLRAQIKKGQSNNLEFKMGGVNLLDDFYRVFSVNMRDLGTPVYSKIFFSNLLSKTTLNCAIVIIYHQKLAVSCGFLLGFKDTIEVPWASTLRSANILNANMVLYWNILTFAIKQQYSFFDFGRSSKDAGTYKFKKQWGAESVQLYWHYWLADGGSLPKLNPNNPKYQLVIKVWQQLPVWVTKVIGPFLAKNLP